MGGAGVTLARDPEHPSYIHSREIFGIAIQAPAIPAAATYYPIADSPKKIRGGRADSGGLQPRNDIDATDAAHRVRTTNPPATRQAQPKPKTNMKHTIILICKGDTPPMKSIVDLLSQSGLEIEHASRRQGGKTHIEIGTPQDLEDVPLPKEVQALKLSPEQEQMFRKLMEIDQQGTTILTTLRSFERYEKREDKKKSDPEGKKKKGGAPEITPPDSGTTPPPADEPPANADTPQEGDPVVTTPPPAEEPAQAPDLNAQTSDMPA